MSLELELELEDEASIFSATTVRARPSAASTLDEVCSLVGRTNPASGHFRAARTSVARLTR